MRNKRASRAVLPRFVRNMLKRTLPTAVLARREQLAVPLELICNSRFNEGALAVPAHKEIRATVRKFVDAEINPHVDAWEAARRFPAHVLFKKMGSLGLLGVNKPVSVFFFVFILAYSCIHLLSVQVEYGGLGLDLSASMAVAEELGRVRCGAVPMAIGVQTGAFPPFMIDR